MLVDIIDRIDEVTSSVCGWCSTKLTPDSHSADFCCEAHQDSWNWDHAGLPEGQCVGDELVINISVDTERFERALRAACEAIRRVTEGIPKWIVFGQSAHEPLTRAERMRAALDARQNRNTGPQRRPRAPKNLGGRPQR